MASSLSDVLLKDPEVAISAGASASAGGLTLALATAGFLGSMSAGLFGYGIGAPNLPQKIIEGDLNLAHGGLAWSAVVASFTLCGLLGTQTAPRLVDTYGRRLFLACNSALFVLGGGLMLAAGLLRQQTTLAYVLLIAGRCAWGLGSGGATVAVPLYLGEIAPASLTGALGSINQFQITIWILVVQALGIFMSTSALWGWLLGGVGAALGAATGLAALALPESPKWLASRGRVEHARAALTTLRGGSGPALEAELAVISAGTGEPPRAPPLSAILADRGMRSALIIAIALQVAQQLSGINAVFFFSTSFFTDAGIADPNYATLSCGAINVAATALAVWLVDRAGRKPLLLLSAGAMLVCAAGITGALVAKAALPGAVGALGGVAIALVLLFVTFFELGMGPIPWMIGAEMVTEGPRATIMAIAAAANWIFTTVIALVFGPVQQALGNYSFLPFCVFLALTVAFTLRYVPETKGRAPEDVLAQLSSGGGGAAYAKVAEDDTIN